jgi:hypothetical protein
MTLSVLCISDTLKSRNLCNQLNDASLASPLAYTCHSWQFAALKGLSAYNHAYLEPSPMTHDCGAIAIYITSSLDRCGITSLYRHAPHRTGFATTIWTEANLYLASQVLQGEYSALSQLI